MAESPSILAIDQGTTSSRAMVFDLRCNRLSTGQREITQIFPDQGWVEHDPEEIWSTTLAVCREAMASRGEDVRVIGIANQRETTVVWDRATGKPIYNAIVWQDRRTAEACLGLKEQGHEAAVSERSGLLIDPYFSATKVAWILDCVAGARQRAERGELAFGTVDCFLLWRLTGGRVHATDVTNASRTNLFNIHDRTWDDELLGLFRVPRKMLPEVRDCAAAFGDTDAELFGRPIPIGAIAGDQQAACVGQACFAPGSVKSTFGTGCFVLLNTGETLLKSRNKLLSTIAYQLDGKPTYAIEGSIFVSGAAVQWLRDGLKVIGSAAETEALAGALDGNAGVYLVPAFVGLGAPYWDADARGAVFGLTRDTGVPELVRATLESVAYQTRDLFDAMAEDGSRPTGLRVDGGMIGNRWLMQFLADILAIPVDRPVIAETTALGAAYLAGLHAGFYSSLEDIAGRWRRADRFEPAMAGAERDRLIAGWRRAVGRLTGEDHSAGR